MGDYRVLVRFYAEHGQRAARCVFVERRAEELADAKQAILSLSKGLARPTAIEAARATAEYAKYAEAGRENFSISFPRGSHCYP